MVTSQEKIDEFKIRELAILREEITQRIGHQVHIFTFFYTLVSVILSYAFVSGVTGLVLIIPLIVSIGEIQISFNKLAEIKLSNYIKKEIEEKINKSLNDDKDEEKIIWWESYLEENLKGGGEYRWPYIIYLFSRFSLFTAFFLIGLFCGIFWLRDQIGLKDNIFVILMIIGYYLLYIIVIYYYRKIYKKKIPEEKKQHPCP